jgi:hypothetical protein
MKEIFQNTTRFSFLKVNSCMREMRDRFVMVI